MSTDMISTTENPGDDVGNALKASSKAIYGILEKEGLSQKLGFVLIVFDNGTNGNRISASGNVDPRGSLLVMQEYINLETEKWSKT